MIYEGGLKAGVQFDFEKVFDWEGATLLVTGLYPHGSSLTDNYVQDFNVLSNIDAYDSIRLYEAWFEKQLGDGLFSIKLGLMLADYEFFLANSSALFLNSAFGAIPVVSQNVESPVYPVAAPGVRVRFSPNPLVSAQFAAFAGDIGDVTGSNRQGTFFFRGNHGALLLGEIAYRNNPQETADAGGPQIAERPLSGTFTIGGYLSTDDIYQATADREPFSNYAVYGIADHELWHEPGAADQGLSAFVRVGGTPDSRSTVTFYADAGFNYKGLLPLRDKDNFGVAASFTRINDKLLGNDGLPLPSHHEIILEVTYLFSISEWLYVQPDFQYIFNPGATDELPDSIVTGIRFGVTF